VPQPSDDRYDIRESVLPLIGDEYAKLFHDLENPQRQRPLENNFRRGGEQPPASLLQL
jgi:hypothetical protein